jgi:uncharacterized protein with HEPN domain
MSAHDPAATLRQIQDAARRLQLIVAGKTLEQLLADWQATAALERFLEIVGEGVKRLPLEIRSRYPAVPWKEIAGTRDRLSHGYDDVDHQVLWNMERGAARRARAPGNGRADAQGFGLRSETVSLYFPAKLCGPPFGLTMWSNRAARPKRRM